MFVSLVLTYLFVTGQATPVSLWVDNAPAPRPVKKEEPKTEPTKKEEPKKEEPKKEQPKEEPKKDEPKKEEPKKEEPKKEEPKKEEPKKEEPKKEEPKKEQPKEEARPGPIGKNPPPKPSTLKKYDDVVTKEAKTTFGLFTVHRFDDKILFEIPQDKLGTLLLWRAETAKTSAGMGYNGAELGKRFIKFERRENKMLMIEPVFDKRAGKDNQAAVEATNTEGIILSMPIEAEGKDRSAVINVTGLYLSDISDIGARRATGGMGGAIDADKSYLSEVKTFPTNIEVRSTLAIRGGGSGMPGLPGMPPAPNPAAARANIALVHFSLVALPDTPMQGRYFDPRVGYFTEQFYEHGGGKGWIHERQFITRYRLEKKDPSAAISEPVKPIVYYIAPEVPEKYRAYIKKGIEDWQPAFEKAGFKNAILCKDPPSKSEDPNWDPEDARWSVIRWVAEPVSNAMGPHVHDPRSGEIISAHVIFWHDIVKLTNLWYFVECSALDERARKFPFSTELTGELIRYVAAHEVGHTLGLRHNHRASQAYSIEQLRDPKFLEANGNVASIMSYGRYNYVAQPEDKIPAKNLIPKIAPYDLFAIEWGYKPVPGQTADSERATLDTWAERQVKEPFLRHGGEDAPASVDPTVLTENIGSDPVKATELGLKNLDRVLDYLVEATTAKGDDFETLRDTYNSINTHRTNWFGAVLKQVGGVVENRTMGGRGEQFSRVPKEKQREAVKFLLDKGFTVPTKLIQPSIVNTLKFSNVGGEAMTLQKVMLTSLLSSERLNRLLDAEILDPDSAYTTADLVSDVQAGLWVELKDETPKIHPMRRSLQQKYVEILIGEFDKHDAGAPMFLMPGRGMLGGGSGRSSELRSVARISLKDLAKQIKAALPGVKDLATRAHLQDCLGEIESVLDAKKK